MIERTPIFNFLTHLILGLGVLAVAFPLWLVFVGSTLTIEQINAPHMQLWPGDQLIANLQAAWARGLFASRLTTSLIMSLGVASGKVVIATLTAFGLVYFRFPGRVLVFWAVFLTLMLPIEVLVVPTFAVAANALLPFQMMFDGIGLSNLWHLLTGYKLVLEWNLLNSYTGLILPLVATATGTFLFRQFFLTIPDHLLEAAKMDGVGPVRFLREILVPLSITNMIALFTIMFLSSWNQYLWPLVATPDRAGFGTTAVVQLKMLSPTLTTTGGGTPDWNVAMAGSLIVMLPPLILVIFLQRWFVRGLVATDK
jgi:sn-glycerol 3-phosphate transport system permease protein